VAFDALGGRVRDWWDGCAAPGEAPGTCRPIGTEPNRADSRGGRLGSRLVDDPSPEDTPITADPGDDYLVALARAAQADYLVSDDHTSPISLIPLRRVLTPRQLIDLVQTPDSHVLSHLRDHMNDPGPPVSANVTRRRASPACARGSWVRLSGSQCKRAGSSSWSGRKRARSSTTTSAPSACCWGCCANSRGRGPRSGDA
jgi:hypothetical protein